MKERQIHRHTEKLQPGGLGSLAKKLQDLTGSVCLFYTVEQKGRATVHSLTRE